MALVLVVSVFTVQAGLEQPASAGDGYPHDNAVDCSAQYGIYSWCLGGTWLSGRGYAYRNCTDYVAWKLESLGVPTSKTRNLGNASTWGTNASARGVTVNGTPAAGSVAINTTAAGGLGHVAYVASVNGSNITIYEYNGGGTGEFSIWTGSPASRGFTQFAHFEMFMPNPPGDGQSGGGSPGSGRLMLVNGQGATYAKDEILGGYSQLNNPNETLAISTGGQYMAIINQCGAVWAKNTLGTSGWAQQTNCGDAQAVEITSTGRVVIMNACSAVWAKDGLQPDGWNQLNNCGETRAIAAAGQYIMIINQCGAAWAKTTLSMSGWAQQTNCGETLAIAIGASGRLMIINQCGEAWAKDGLQPSGWAQQTSCGDTRAIAVGGSRLAIINGQGAGYAKDDIVGPYSQLTPTGNLTSLAVGDNGRIMTIDACGAAWAKDTLGMGGWAQQTSCGDTRAVQVG